MTKVIMVLITICFLCAGTELKAQTSVNDTALIASKNIRTVKLKVKGINCSADTKDIQREVSKLEGIVSCSLKGKPGAVTAFEVSYDPAKVSEKQILNAVEGTAGCSDPASRPYKGKI